MHLKFAFTTLWFVVLVQSSKIPTASHKIESSRLHLTDEEMIVQKLENAQMLKELEVLIKNLDDDQLDNLEMILKDDEEDTEDTEFGRVKQELLDMGVEEQDIEDLKALAALMTGFLEKIPNIERKLELKSEADLLDHVQLYLLGLPNKLGPLGFIALHHVLDNADEPEGDGEIVDVVIEPSSIAKIKEMEEARLSESSHHVPASQARSEAPLFRRRRSLTDMMTKVNKVAAYDGVI